MDEDRGEHGRQRGIGGDRQPGFPQALDGDPGEARRGAGAQEVDRRAIVRQTPPPDPEQGEEAECDRQSDQQAPLGRDLQVVVESAAGLKDARLRVYSAAMVLVAEEPLGALGPGWHRRQVSGQNLDNGLYWVKLSEGAKALGPPARMLVLR
jgi:hypothetical protein